MPLFLKSKLCFIHIPRSGGSYIENLFHYNNDPGIFLSPYQYLNGCSPQHQQYELLKILNIIPDDFQTFAIIRDHIDRFVSEFNWLKLRYGGLSEEQKRQLDNKSVGESVDMFKVLHPETTFNAFLDNFLNLGNNCRYDNHNMPNEWFLKGNNTTNPIRLINFSDLYKNDGKTIVDRLNEILNTSLQPIPNLDTNSSDHKDKFVSEQILDQDKERISEYIETIA
jgi:hypothetical protein